MVVVLTMFFDSDDYQVKCDAMPCENADTARKLAKRIYEKIIDTDYSFETKDEMKEWEKRSVMKKKDGGYFINGGDCGYAEIIIVDKKPVLETEVDNVDVKTHPFY